jgi:hypothetical protein
MNERLKLTRAFIEEWKRVCKGIKDVNWNENL